MDGLIYLILFYFNKWNINYQNNKMYVRGFYMYFRMDLF